MYAPGAIRGPVRLDRFPALQEQARNASATVGEESDWAGGCAFVDVITGANSWPADDVNVRFPSACSM